MTKLPRLLLYFTLVHSASAAAQSINCIGTLPGGGQSWGSALSRDGTVVVGGAEESRGTNRAFQWTTTNGMVSLGSLGASNSEAKGVSGDGTVVVGESGLRAFRWTASTGMQDLGTLPGQASSSPSVSARAISQNGAVIVGRSYTDNNFSAQAFRWTAGSGMVGLESLPGGSRSEANGVNSDGSIIVGFSGVNSGSDVVACRWLPGGVESLGVSSGARGSWASATNSDGSVVVGLNYFDSWTRPQSAFRWTVQGGMQDLGCLYLGYQGFSAASGVSADGSIVVGASGIWGESRVPFLWHSSFGMTSLESYLRNRGADLSGWSSFWGELGISADGRWVTGSGVYEGQWRAFVADIGVIPTPCSLSMFAVTMISRRRRKP